VAATIDRQPAYLLTTVVHGTVRQWLPIYFDRWQTEVNHREEKDSLSGPSPATQLYIRSQTASLGRGLLSRTAAGHVASFRGPNAVRPTPPCPNGAVVLRDHRLWI
jgi:hypothetical protein